MMTQNDDHGHNSQNNPIGSRNSTDKLPAFDFSVNRAVIIGFLKAISENQYQSIGREKGLSKRRNNRCFWQGANFLNRPIVNKFYRDIPVSSRRLTISSNCLV